MKKWLFCVLFCAPLAYANDSAVTGASGRLVRMDKEHANVAMVSETIDITISNLENYTTDATFVFHNEGAAQTVKMGFPERSRGDRSLDVQKSSFLKFETWVDGQKIVARRVMALKGDEDEEALWVKSVTFGRNQTRRVRVRYTSLFGETAGVPYSRWVSYDFTGGNWKGKVTSSRLTVHLERPGTYIVGARTDHSKPQFVRRGRDFIYTWQNWQAEEWFSFSLDTTLRGWLDAPDFYNSKTQRIYGALFPANIEIAGQKADETHVDFLPLGVWRNEELFVSLRAWLDFRAKKRAFLQHWDAKTRTATIESEGKSIAFRAGENGAFSVDTPFNGPVLFVPASILGRNFAAGFRLDEKAHSLEFLK